MVNWFLATFWLNFWVALLVLATLGPRIVTAVRRWWWIEQIKADARARHRITKNATHGFARDAARLRNTTPIPRAEPAVPHELTEEQQNALDEWQQKNAERRTLLGR